MKPVAQYLSFTGNSGCYGVAPILNGATTFTIEIKFSTTNSATRSSAWECGTIFGLEIAYYGKDDGALYVQGGKLKFWCSPASKGTDSTNTQIVASNATVNDGNVHKVAVVSNADGSLDLYCDSKLVAHADNVNAKISATPWQFAYNSNSYSYLQMDLHEARFWNVARTQAEIFADIDGTETGLQAWYLPSEDGLLDYSGNERHATLYGNPAYTEIETLPVTLNADIERNVANDAKLIDRMKVWLPFDESTTKDLCGNSWTAYGSPTIEDGKLKLNGSNQYLALDGGIALGGQDFTIRGKANISTATGNYSRIFQLHKALNTAANEFCLYRYSNQAALRFDFGGTDYGSFAITFGEVHDFEFDYRHDAGKLYFFIDGALKTTLNTTLARITFDYCWLGRSSFTADGYFVGTIDEFQIYDGIALHTENFTPPTNDDYVQLKLALGKSAPLNFVADVQRKLSNSVEVNADLERILRQKWRYTNAGTADDLIITGTTLTDLPADKSVTGTAFYQTTRAKCFDLPTTEEIWIKFDVYFNGSNRWRAYNDEGTGTLDGISAQQTSTSTGTLSFFAETNSSIYQGENVTKKNQLQTVLLHMVTGSTAGVVEAWVDGEKIHTYTGDVNHGEDFAVFYLQSDGAGTFFSNVIIANYQIGLNDGYQIFTVDVQRKIANAVEVNADLQRNVIAPIVVPFIGEHFNHYVPNVTIFRDVPQPIILPKKSDVFIRADGNGIVKIFSDTDSNGFFTGDIYAALAECNVVYIAPFNTSAAQIASAFVGSLNRSSLIGFDALDEAINFCSNGSILNTRYLVDTFFFNLNNAASYEIFLENYCDIFLHNDDTGAVTGFDAGGGDVKDASTIVPDTVPISEWTSPELGGTSEFSGLIVHWPERGANGSLTNTERHILEGLNSVWIAQSLKLIKKSLGIDFLDAGATNRDLYILFVNDGDVGNLAATWQGYNASGDNVSIELRINMRFYNNIDLTSVDGRISSASQSLDRTIAHELTHAVMAANIKYFLRIPAFIEEGTAELVHGIDDVRRNTIVKLVSTDEGKTKLQEIFDSGGDNNDADVYSAGYLILRYLIKQVRDNIPTINELPVSNLLISDSGIDSDYNSLTDNTRLFLLPTIERTLIKSTEFAADLMIQNVFLINLIADISRNLINTFKLYETDNSEYFSGGTSAPVVIPSQEIIPPQENVGLQSIEISIAEQQLTDSVKIVTVIPLDVMFPVRGQYFDYFYDMRVERVQQRGVLFSADCCSDIDALLYTQMAYSLPSDWIWQMQWRKVGEEPVTQKIKTHYPPASAHVTRIADALGLSPVIQFDDFLSTVLMDDLGGVTYADLIRDLFGWSSRVPTMLINAYIRGDKLFVIQRGHESNVIDITGADMTLPTITREILRTAWGSSLWSKTETREMPVYNVPDDETISDDSGSGDDSGDDSGSGSGDDDEENWVTVRDESFGIDWHAVTVYFYYRKPAKTMGYTEDSILQRRAGLLAKVETTKTFNWGVDKPDSLTEIFHAYDEDRTKIQTVTEVQYFGFVSGDLPPDTRTVNNMHYITLPNGQKFLARESTYTYEDDELVDSTVMIHSPTNLGQTHTVKLDDEGGIIGEVVGQDTGDDRVTPFAVRKSRNMIRAVQSGSGSGSGNDGWTTEKQSRTLNGISLYDSSFPIHNEDKLITITEELKRLNRRTQETVTFALYNFPHLIDFNDRVILNGIEYFLVNNTASTTPRLFNEQNLTLRRWV